MGSPSTSIECRHNLRLQPTRLIGRDQDVEVVCQRLLQPDVRLLTLTGPGGTGKTRLALEAGTLLLDLFEQGVFFVDLAPLSDPQLVLPTVAQSLGIAEVAGLSLLEHLTDVLATQQILLVLDNCEHVASAAPNVAHLLATCPGVRVLATSREPLHLSWERLHPVAPLPVPNLGDLPASDELSQVPAVTLFVERARAVRPGFTLDESNARAVAELCVRLDGLPLAIELAAARSNVLPPGALLDRLAQHLDLLKSDARDEPARHRTLQAAIAWSYDLLSSDEQLLLRRLSVFAGGWTIEAAECVCADAPIKLAAVLDLLSRLVQCSLVVADEREGQVRYRLLETVRQFAAAELAESVEAAAVYVRHLDWYLDLAEHSPWTEADSREAVSLSPDHDNFRAALRWSLTMGDANRGLRLGVGLWRLWYFRSFHTEGRTWLTKLLGLPDAAASASRAMALSFAGHLAYCQGDLATAEALVQEGLGLSRQRGDGRGSAASEHILGLIAHSRSDLARAQVLFEAAMQHNQALDNRVWEAIARHGLVRVLLDQDEYERARVLGKANLAFFQERGNTWGVATTLWALGMVAKGQRDFVAAEAHQVRALEAFLEMGNRQGVVRALAALGHGAHERGNRITAHRYYAECLRVARDSGDRLGLARAFEGLASLLADAQPDCAARLVGAAEHLRQTIGAPTLAVERQRLEEWVPAARHRLGDQPFAWAYAAGREMTLDQACAEALRTDPDTLGSVGNVLRAPLGSRDRDVLSPREHEVANLIAEGRTNHEIAQALVVTDRTAEHHVENILGKLGLNSRTQIGVWVVEHGLRASGGR
jgi:predicted ATPase/DNA-binding CsgD family transcriptional regulator